MGALYRRLPDLLQPEGGGDVGGRKTASCVTLVYDCLDAALGKRRELSTARVAAMIKRLLSVSLQLTQVRGKYFHAVADSSGLKNESYRSWRVKNVSFKSLTVHRANYRMYYYRNLHHRVFENTSNSCVCIQRTDTLRPRA